MLEIQKRRGNLSAMTVRANMLCMLSVVFQGVVKSFSLMRSWRFAAFDLHLFI